MSKYKATLSLDDPMHPRFDSFMAAFHYYSLNQREDLIKSIQALSDDLTSADFWTRDRTERFQIDCLSGNLENIEFFLERVDFNAELTKEIFKKYRTPKTGRWSDNFEKMTILSYAVINNKKDLVSILIKHEVNVGIKDKNNKTLLMYAVENDNSRIVSDLLSKMKGNFQLINARDDRGFHAFNYVLTGDKLKRPGFRSSDYMRSEQGYIVAELVDAGADFNVSVNGNPMTLILNMAAARNYPWILERLFTNFDSSLSNSSTPLALVLVSLKVERVSGRVDKKKIQDRVKCMEEILKYWALRREFGIFVPELEVNLMEKLIANNSTFKRIVEDFKEGFIGSLKNQKVQNFKILTVHSYAVHVFNRKNLNNLIKDSKFLENFYKFSDGSRDEYNNVLKAINKRIKEAVEKKKLFEKVKEIPVLREFIPFPYEITLEILENLENYNLKNFIQAFYQDSISF